MKISIDPEFHALIPPLSSDELAQLEANIKVEGCRDPLVVWRTLIVDGHNRYGICEEAGIDYQTVPLDADDRDEVKAWIIRNQFGRRNINSAQRAELVLKLKPLIAAKAKEQQKQSGGAVPQKLAEPPIETRLEIAKAAGVSHGTVRKVELVAEAAKADPDHFGDLPAKMTRTGKVDPVFKEAQERVEKHPVAAVPQLKPRKKPEVTLWDWAKAIQVVYEIFSSVEKQGGVNALLDTWDDERTEDYLRTFRDMLTRCEKYIPVLEKRLECKSTRASTRKRSCA